MGQKTLIGTCAGLVAGLAIGFAGANYINRTEPAGTPVGNVPPTAAVPASPQQPGQPNSNQVGMMGDVQTTLDNAKANPKDAEAQIKAADLYLEIQRYDDALQFYSKAAELKPDSFEANANIGQIYMGKKEFVKAGEFYAKALEVNKTDAGLRSDLGLTFYLREPPDSKRAIKEYKRALEIDPNHEAALQNLTVALKGIGEKEEYSQVIVRLRKVNPNNPALKEQGP